MNNDMAKRIVILAFAAVVVGLTGCQQAPATADVAPTGGVKFTDTLSTTPPASAGVEMPANPAEGLPDSPTLAKTMSFTSRRDPFSLLSEESRFDRAQASERLAVETGGFGNEFPEPDASYYEPPQLMPKPAWRLAGVIISEGGVIGLLDMGSEVIQIRPGMNIPDNPFTVVSIDSQRAVLRRTDGQIPRETEIELSGPISGGAAPAAGRGGATGGRGGFQGGGFPGGPGRKGANLGGGAATGN